MAGGKTPRDKMINLMYLVFISMMAMNMSKQVLAAFGMMNLKMEDANTQIMQVNNASFEALSLKANENKETYGKSFEIAKKVKKMSDDYYNYLAGVKEDVLSQAGPKEDTIARTDYQVMDKADFLDEKFFLGDKLKKDGQEFDDNYVNYAKGVIKLVQNDDKLKFLVPIIEKRFEHGDKEGKITDREGIRVNWLHSKLEGFPYIASVAFMTQIQSDIRKTEQELYTAIVGAGLTQQVSMTNYTTLLEQGKGAFYSGQKFEGAIVLGRKDNATYPARVDLKVDGRKLSSSEYDIQGGKVVLKFITGSVGEHKITGTLFYAQDGKETPVKVEQVYTTIPRPNEAVISADKMNVVYVGVDNPMTISMPGVSDNLISASAPGLRKVSGSSYVMRPSKGGKAVVINVTGTIEGEKFSSSKKFRVKNLPKPEGAIFKQTGATKFPKANVAAGHISVVYDNFDFDIKANVVSFTVLVDGERVTVKGNRVSSSSRAVKAIKRARKGSIVQISDIRYKVSGYSGYAPPAAPISIEITQ